MDFKKYTVKVYANGDKHWYLDGKRHREDGPACEYANGNKHWYLDGELHREDGPAIEWADGDKEWYLDGKRHREDGPACEYANGNKHWFLNGKDLSKQEFNKKTATKKAGSSCAGKVVLIDGKKYKLTEVK